ncbi:MAG: hypothetical protein M1267_03910 [Candidatus Thermoplasmatota archaeon]|nr:hypothetical protein [Candidatus Thermoplasmatota archaeon]
MVFGCSFALSAVMVQLYLSSLTFFLSRIERTSELVHEAMANNNSSVDVKFLDDSSRGPLICI